MNQGDRDEGMDDTEDSSVYRGGKRWLLAAIVGAVIGGAALVIGIFTDPKQTAFAYLIAFQYVFTMALGALAFLLAVHAMGATWPTAIRRVPEAVSASLPIFVVLFLPILLGSAYLYPWVNPEQLHQAEALHLIEHKRPYLNLPFALVRLVAFFAFWIGVSHVLRAWSLRMDRPAAPGWLRPRLKVVSSVALPFFGIFSTMAMWDWVMSLSPTWFSTMFGLNFLAGGFLGAIGVVILLVVAGQRAALLPFVNSSHHYALGRLLFAFLIFWAYTGYFQYFLMWIANKPIEVEWFVRRTQGGYAAVALFLVFGHFGLPFLLLLFYWIKRRARALAGIAGWLVAAHYLDVHWAIAAEGERASPFAWQDLAALLFVAGTAGAFALWRQRGVALAPRHDPAFARAVEYESL